MNEYIFGPYTYVPHKCHASLPSSLQKINWVIIGIEELKKMKVLYLRLLRKQNRYLVQSNA